MIDSFNTEGSKPFSIYLIKSALVNYIGLTLGGGNSNFYGAIYDPVSFPFAVWLVEFVVFDDPPSWSSEVELSENV